MAKLDPIVVHHDIFNLLSVFILISLTINFLSTGVAFVALWWGTQAYFIVDIVWVVLVPKSVRDPAAIIIHHLITMLFIMVPHYYPRFQRLMGLNMLVEINTWLLILKRHYKSVVLEALFYTTWVVMRLIVYPYLVVYYWHVYIGMAEELGTFVTILVLAPTIQFMLTGMNVWWTVTMLRQLMARRKAAAALKSQ